MIQRLLLEKLKKKLHSGKALILLGARQTGKTTLLKSLAADTQSVLWMDADEPETQAIFERPSSASLKLLFGKTEIVIIDEAQRIRNIGVKLKLITDQLKHIQVIATGSSSFDLTNDINEPLTGRKWEFNLYPLSFEEMVKHHGYLKERGLIEQRLIYGSYPEVVIEKNNPVDVLNAISNSYLYKDVLQWENVKKPDKIVNLLRALAFQVGHQVSYNELGQMTGLNNITIEKYIDLLEKTFVIFRLPSFSRNIRNEIKSSRKIYFWDNGMRNSIIANFNPLSLRQDVGALWENYIISERKKYLANNQILANTYFWRNHDQQEIDYVEEKNGQYYAYEFKWSQHKKHKFPNGFVNTYSPVITDVVGPKNMEEFVLEL
jgi:uncharacterized protein